MYMARLLDCYYLALQYSMLGIPSVTSGLYLSFCVASRLRVCVACQNKLGKRMKLSANSRLASDACVAAMVAVAILIGQTTAASAQGCGSAPVVKADHAICLARQFTNRDKAPWELEFHAKEAKSHWTVSYKPINHQVRGGAGDLKVDKKSGQVTFIKGYR
jgi:hypothetical protein